MRVVQRIRTVFYRTGEVAFVDEFAVTHHDDTIGDMVGGLLRAFGCPLMGS